MNGFEIDPERLSASGAALQSVAARLTQELTAFQSELAGFGAPWGNDDIGSLIGAAHDEVSSFAFECYQSALEEIDSAGADVTGMGELHAQTDAGVAERFTKMLSELDG